MNVLKRASSALLALAMLFTVCSNGMVALAAGEEFSVSVSFQKYDEATHAILDGEITQAAKDDIIVATYSLTNNSGSNMLLSDIQLFFQYPQDLLQAYPKDETDEDWAGPFYNAGYKTLAMDGVINTELSGKTNIALVNQAGVAHKKGDTVAYAQIAYKVIKSPGEVVLSFDTNEQNQVRSTANNASTPRTLDVSGSFKLTLEGGESVYEVKFDGNGATSGSMNNQSFPGGAVAALSENKYAKEGSTFDGWNDKQDGSGNKYADKAQFTPKEGVTTLYAQWKENPKTYEVKFDGNGATSGSMNNQSFPDGATAALSENKYVKEGSTFDGWNDKQDGSGNKYANKAQFTPKEGVITLYAQWKENPKTYEVKFDGNGATSGSMNNQSFPDGAAAALSENKYAKEGSTFDGWNDKQDGSGNKYADKAQFTPKEGVTTLYAQWKANPKTYEVKFDGNGATSGSMNNQSFPDGATAALSENKYVKEGSTFDGWNDKQDGSGNKYADKAQFTPKEGVTTLYAQWKQNPGNEFAVSVYFQKYDETTHKILDGEITTATEGDVIVATYSLNNNSANMLLSDIQLFFQYPQEFLQAYPKDETDTEWAGPFYNAGYKTLAMDGVINTDLSGKTNIVLANQAGVAHKKDATVAYAQVAYKVIKTPGDATLSFDTNEQNQVRSTANNVSTPRTLDVSSVFTLKLESPVKTYTVQFDGNGETSGSMNPQTFEPDKEQKLTKNAFAKTGYKFVGWSEIKDGELKYTDEQSVKIGASVKLYAKWEPKEYKIEAVQTEGGTVEADKTTAKEGDPVTLTITPKTADGYVFDTLTVTDNEGEITATRSNAMTSGSSIIFTFTVRKSDVKVKATFTKGPGGPYKIEILSSVPAEGGTVESEKSEAVKDEEVTLKVTPDLNKGYVLKELTVTGSDGTKVIPQMKENSNTTYAFSEHSFKMPDLPSDGFVTVQAEFAIPRLVTLPEKVEHGSVSSDKQPTAYVGETVTLTVTPDTNYQLKADFPKVTKADGTAITPNKVDEKTYTFVMENSDATVSVEFESKASVEITVTYKPGEGSGSEKTETVKLPFKLPGNPGFTPPSDKTFDGWTLPDGKFYAVDAEISELANNSTITAHYKTSGGGGGCYVATAVYGSYDCPEVWTLRRFRDHVLAKTWYGRLFIKLYYAVSPTAVKLFGDADWFQSFWRGKLDSMVSNLQADGFESTPYQDMDW